MQYIVLIKNDLSNSHHDILSRHFLVGKYYHTYVLAKYIVMNVMVLLGFLTLPHTVYTGSCGNPTGTFLRSVFGFLLPQTLVFQTLFGNPT